MTASKQVPSNIEVSVLNIVPQAHEFQINLPGRVRSSEEAQIRPQVSGIITKRNFAEGQIVQQGDSLYQIDSAIYDAQLEKARADLTQAKAKLNYSKNQENRLAKLIETNAISKQDYDDAKATYREDLAAVIVAKSAVHMAKINLSYTQLKAPITGNIGISNVTPGALVTANQTQQLAMIQKLDPINVDIAQSSTQLLNLQAELSQGSLQAATNASVTLLLANGNTFSYTGKLQFSQVSVDENSDSVLLRASFPNPKGVLLPGMYVKAIINVGQNPHSILVPQNVISRNAQGQAIAMIVSKDNKVVSRKVTTANVVNHQWRITQGLHQGDKVIVNNLQKIHPGMSVTIAPTGTRSVPTQEIAVVTG